MSVLRAQMRRDAREDRKFQQYLSKDFLAPFEARTMHGTCQVQGCTVRGTLVLPAQICLKRHVEQLAALVWAARQLGVQL